MSDCPVVGMDVLLAAIACCDGWEPDVRLIGNVRAVELGRLLRELQQRRNVDARAAALRELQQESERLGLYDADQPTSASVCPFQGPGKSVYTPTLCPVCNNDFRKCAEIRDADQPGEAGK